MNKSKVENGEVIEFNKKILRKFDKEFKRSFEGGDMWNWERAEPIKAFITNALQEQRDEGFKQGFEACRKDIREGKHLNCCYKKDLTNALNQQRRDLIKKIKEELDDEAVDLIPYNADERHLERFKEFLTKLEK